LNRTEAEENRPLLSQNKTEPIHLSFHNVSFSVKVKKETKVLLDNINGWAKPGEILAIMGNLYFFKKYLISLYIFSFSITPKFKMNRCFWSWKDNFNEFTCSEIVNKRNFNWTSIF